MNVVTIPVNQDVRSRQNADAARLRVELEEKGIYCLKYDLLTRSGEDVALAGDSPDIRTGRLRMGV